MTVRDCCLSLACACGMLALVLAGNACSSKSPNAPTFGVSGVTLSSTNAVAGAVVQGTVTFTNPAPVGGLSIVLTSSNPSVATVSTPVNAPSGATSAAIAVTTVGQGSTTITASLNGTTAQSAPLTVGELAIASFSLSASSVVGGNPVTGFIGLTGGAPAGGAIISLSSTDPLTAPATVTIGPGASTATFAIATRAVPGEIAATVTAAYGGGSKSASLSVLPVPPAGAVANFGVTGPHETETCELSNSGNTLSCIFNGSGSTAPGTIVAWEWTYGVAKMFTQTTTGPVLTNPAIDCSIIPAPPLPAGTSWYAMPVKLVIRDDRGNVSQPSIHTGTRLFPQGTCGY